MATTLNRLSARTISTTSKPGMYADGGGLYLCVTKTGAKRWSFVFRSGDKRTEMGLGSASVVKITEAREQAEAFRKVLANGGNPLEERRARQAVEAAAEAALAPEGPVAEPVAAAPSFGDCAEKLIKSLRPGWKNPKHADQWEKAFKATSRGPGYAEKLMDLPVADVNTDHVLSVLEPIWMRLPDTASKVRGRIERVLDSARARGLRSGENPARLKGHLDHLLPKQPKLVRGHQRAIPYEQAPAAYMMVKGREGAAFRALQFLMLVCLRESEVLGATAQEFDLVNAIWTIPAARMKGTRGNRKDHRVPLSPSAVELVRTMIETVGAGPEGYVFPGQRRGRPLSNQAMDAALDRLKIDAVPHGFRSTFRDWAGDCTDHAREVVEEALAHIVGSEVERAYRRRDALEKRRVLMNDWAQYLTSKLNSVALR